MYTYFSLIDDVITYFPDKPIKIIDELDDSSIYSAHKNRLYGTST